MQEILFSVIITAVISIVLSVVINIALNMIKEANESAREVAEEAEMAEIAAKEKEIKTTEIVHYNDEQTIKLVIELQKGNKVINHKITNHKIRFSNKTLTEARKGENRLVVQM